MIACGTVSTLLLVYLLASDSVPAAPSTLGVVLWFVATVIGGVFLVAWMTEDGVRGPHRFNRRPVHNIRGRAAAKTQPLPPPKQVRPRTPYWNSAGPDDGTKTPR